MNAKELNGRAQVIHREWCDASEHDVPCWGPTADDYSKAKSASTPSPETPSPYPNPLWDKAAREAARAPETEQENTR